MIRQHPRYSRRFDTPFGQMRVTVDEDDALTDLILPNGHDHWAKTMQHANYDLLDDSPRCDHVLKQLDEYFAGNRHYFDLRLNLIGTEFQRQVWLALTTIPCGTTISYRDLAARINKPAAVRAVGAANGRNPIPIIVPCHRVIGADGTLTGFGGGLPMKAALLDLEGVAVASHNHPKQLRMLPDVF